LAASRMWAGVAKSGSPSPKEMTSTPSARSFAARSEMASVAEGARFETRDARAGPFTAATVAADTPPGHGLGARSHMMISPPAGGTTMYTSRRSTSEPARPSTTIVARKTCAVSPPIWKSLLKSTRKVTIVEGLTL